jgi:hypothetical protein
MRLAVFGQKIWQLPEVQDWYPVSLDVCATLLIHTFTLSAAAAL